MSFAPAKKIEQAVPKPGTAFSPLVFVPIGVTYLVVLAATFLYLQDWIHPCLPAFVILGIVTALAWFHMLVGDKNQGPDLLPAVKLITGWLAYGLFFRGRAGVFPEILTVLSGTLAILLVAVSYTPMFYRKQYVSKMMSQIYLLLVLFVPTDDINVAPDMATLLVFIKVTIFYLVHVLSDFETRLAPSDRGDYYRSRERRVFQSLWVLFTWGQTFTLFFGVLQVLVLVGLMVVSSMADTKSILPVTQSDIEEEEEDEDAESSEDEEEEEDEEPPAPTRRRSPSPRRGRGVYRGRGRRVRRAMPRGRSNGSMVRRGAPPPRGRRRMRGRGRRRPPGDSG